ncbi:MAG: hypothetical protein IT460_17700 [Planctomycetes bacterium]|nr:hypothetical protein [Planctomycetota bacterium]
MAVPRLLVAATAVATLVLSACASSSGRRPSAPPFPTDPDVDATYCRVWVPPTYREVPRLVECAPCRVEHEKAFRRELTFKEVCTPGSYETKCTPCRTRTEVEVQATPGRTDWAKVDCGCGTGECYRPVEVPPTTCSCEKTVTEKGVSYCAFHAPTYDVVMKEKRVCVDRPVHVPAEYRVVWEKQEFEPGRWEWHKRTDCAEPTCGVKTVRAPSCSDPCDRARRGNFNWAPPAD